MAQTSRASPSLAGPVTEPAARAAGPERLQAAIRITTPASWLIGAIFAFITVAVLVWGVLGVLTTRVAGIGIVMAEDGDVYELRSVDAGTVVALTVGVGDTVEAGQLVARIGQPGDDARIDAASKRVERLQQGYDLRRAQVDADLVERRQATERHVAVLEGKKQTLQQRVGYLSDLLGTVEEQRREGIVTEARLQEVRTALADARLQLNESDVEIAQANLDYLEFEDQRQDDLETMRRDIEEASTDLEMLRRTRADRSRITATRSGRVIGVSAQVGDLVTLGAPVVRVDAEGDGLRVLGFFEAPDGKKIGPGMDVSVSPSTAEPAIWGTINGTVKRVSQLPETLGSVINLLGNEQLAQQIFASGPPILVEVEMASDPSTPSGLDWSSGSGPPYRITHGTMSAVSVVVREEAPANLVAPVFWRWIGHGS
ncbi:NHLP bacteriocin system secretion protein [Salinarimonas sp.]|uniref:NHLP bacteriocin system secretion protein n=1 Tax=Salinarimonas sp. TaxID=2766526 RepID=UPI0032D8DC3F